ncbi:MAG: HTH domain-containing protein [Candidatus Woesearchaeota archaeon]|nr:HTH domain-containing protein [Candidatus Woesearchaeota archaeon]
MFIERKIVIIKTRRAAPPLKDINDELQWFGNSLGLFGERDRDKSQYRIFVELIKNSEKGISSDELAYKLGLSRSAVVHHLNHMMTSGIVIASKNKYLLRVNNLQQLVDELKDDMNRLMDELRNTAKDIDNNIRNY